jgi:hypothetical protein
MILYQTDQKTDENVKNVRLYVLSMEEWLSYW